MELPFVSWSSPSSSTASQSWRLASSASVPISRSPSLGWPQVDPAPSPCYAAAGAVLLTAALGVSCQRPVASRASLPRRRQLVGLRADAEQGGQDSGARTTEQSGLPSGLASSVCYFTRQSLSYTAPVLRQAMGWKGLTELGQLSSLFPLAYGSSRFLGGVLGDLMSPKKVFVLGLSVCSLLNIAFGLSSTLPQFAFFWFLNGCFQGLVAPPCVKMITNWFDPKERGFLGFASGFCHFFYVCGCCCDFRCIFYVLLLLVRFVGCLLLLLFVVGFVIKSCLLFLFDTLSSCKVLVVRVARLHQRGWLPDSLLRRWACWFVVIICQLIVLLTVSSIIVGFVVILLLVCCFAVGLLLFAITLLACCN
ncbi:unnamed protein product [Polarella glacialis]|uniref:Major facilitator superfamily (MFS) profile domain-containing protein n=1 Tax=Polarella glacialis TaxID=89957 RepID=A0A813EGI6_POLGL|nr:unnamed protein product [Polarella glacialis]